MLSCISTTGKKAERLTYLVSWFIWIYDDLRTYKH